ncbi:hypothetical protein SAMN05660443_1983 [Marinospirillum celere]|uniref:Uncharacterized protein n=1 Tax=Marinospirillum celere TaxID=1122252 RepID=A0A1I1HRA0_9GAMM|nr:hypothetical protein [Marinospirillum celere]SFC26617.1 hypothetical protein SAMN05660443_1983 [Marinospirillum celere]
MTFRLFLLALCLLAFSSTSIASTQSEGFHDPLEHRLTLIKSRLMMTREHFAYFDGFELQQSASVEANNLIRALQYSLCPLNDDQQQVRLHRIETFGIFLRMVSLAEGWRPELPESVPANQFMGLRLLKACQDGQHYRVLEAALELVDDQKT